MQQQIDDVARVYAESLYELAAKDGNVAPAQEIGAELAAFADAVRSDRRFAEFLRTPVIDRKAREKSLKSILTGRVSDLLVRFILVVNRKGRAGSLADIEQAYDALLQEKLGKVEVDLWTAGPIGPDQLESIKTRVQAALGKDVVMHAYIDASILGGLKLRIGDRLIDGSVAAKLRAMRSHLSAGSGDVRGRFQQFLEPS
ncbi:MAG: ATP synthase F1 subunit delta [Phycisphaerae bacterium]|nr:ATP synthase F1 subunit delta [Phycisphaerae bacterium]